MSKFNFTVAGLFFLLSLPSFAQTTRISDLHQLVNNKEVKVFNRELSLIHEGSRLGLHLSKDAGEGVAWLKGIEFSNGVLEFDVRGEDVKQGSFVGIAFHGANDSTYDAIYLRPFQFKATDPVLRKRSIQYISLPEFTWRNLREKFPTKYENTIEPAPDPNAWIRVRLVINNASISVYINGNNEPSLVTEKLTPVTTGMIGFYVADNSGGDFANISITKTK